MKSQRRDSPNPTSLAISRKTSGVTPESAPTRPYFSLYCYPWDVLDEGPKSFAKIAEQTGLTNISMAASYHGGKALLPHNSKSRVYYIEDGAIYFRPSRKYFGTSRIKPRVSKLLSKGDVFQEIVDACRDRGVATTAWTVALHNTHLGEAYPDLTTQNVFGDRYVHSLCPSQPDVMAYLRALAGNLASYPIDAVELESFEYIPFRHYSSLEKEGISVTPFANLLMSLCFCSACQQLAKQSRINAPALTKPVKAWLIQYFEGKHRRPKSIESEIPSIPGLAEYLHLRFNILCGGFKEIADLLHAENKRVIPIVVGQEQRLDYLTGVDLHRFGSSSNAIETLFYGRHAGEAAGVIKSLQKATGQDTSVYLAVRPGHPDAGSANDVVSMTNSILENGGRGISYYNFGLFEKNHLDWVRRAIRQSSFGTYQAARASGNKSTNKKIQAAKGLVRPNVLRTAF